MTLFKPQYLHASSGQSAQSACDLSNYEGEYDDVIIFDWMDKKLPSNSHILAAANELSVIPSSTHTGLVGSDAGIWIPQLIDRKITLMPYKLDFFSSKTINRLCQKQINYIYIGGESQSFSIRELDRKADWYKEIISLPNVQLYQLIACSSTN